MRRSWSRWEGPGADRLRPSPNLSLPAQHAEEASLPGGGWGAAPGGEEEEGGPGAPRPAARPAPGPRGRARRPRPAHEGKWPRGAAQSRFRRVDCQGIRGRGAGVRRREAGCRGRGREEGACRWGGRCGVARRWGGRGELQGRAGGAGAPWT